VADRFLGLVLYRVKVWIDGQPIGCEWDTNELCEYVVAKALPEMLDAGLREAVEILQRISHESCVSDSLDNFGCPHCDAGEALAALTGEAPRREDTPTGDSDG
jgi:hypothetical protein